MSIEQRRSNDPKLQAAIEALEKIAAMEPEHDEWHAVECYTDCQKIARDTLERIKP
jgi:ribonuclease HI